MRRSTSLLINAAKKLAKAVWVYMRHRYFFRSLLVLDLLWVLVWVVVLTVNDPKVFSVIALVVGLVVAVALVPFVYRRVIDAVDTWPPLQVVLTLVVPITIVGGLVWPHYGWCDRFGGTEIDGNRWRVQTDPGLIDVRNGRLTFNADAGRPQGDTGGGLLARVPENRDIAEVSFITSLESYQGSGSGGAGVGFDIENGRDIAFKVGPGPNGPEGEFWACETFSCGSIGGGDYEDYVTDTSTFRSDGEATPIRVVQTDDGIKFYIDGELREFYPRGELFEEATLFQEARPIVGFGFSMYADEGTQFRLTVDDVCVEYGVE